MQGKWMFISWEGGEVKEVTVEQGAFVKTLLIKEEAPDF
jgi:hypothetical protein